MTNANSPQKAIDSCNEICDQFCRKMEDLDIPASATCGIAFFENVSEKLEAVTKADHILFKAKKSSQKLCFQSFEEEVDVLSA